MENFLQPRRIVLRDLEAYRISFELSNWVWDTVLNWAPLAQQTVGTQFIRAVDSISANIAEGFGRHGRKDKIKFYRIARGSLCEAMGWNEKAFARKLLAPHDHQRVAADLQRLPKSINTLT